MTDMAVRNRRFGGLGSILLALALASGLIGGFAAAPVAAADDPSIAQQKQKNDALQAYIDKMKAMLAGDPCATPAQAQALLFADPLGGLSGGGVADKTGDASAKQPIGGATPDQAGKPADAAPKADTPPGKPLDRQTLAGRLHNAVALVIADHSTGSGFFVAPNILMTNNHVVEGNKGPDLVVIGQGLAGVRPAHVLAQVAGQGFGARDYALLKVEGPGVQDYLSLTETVEDLEKVVAAGYPGLLLDNDMAFRSLLKGDLSAMPQLAMSQGSVMALQNRDRLLTIAHSAPISGGNSGGPLVDQCGRVVGVNTYINVSVQQASSAGFAIASHDVIAYLKENGVPVQIRSERCEE